MWIRQCVNRNWSSEFLIKFIKPIIYALPFLIFFIHPLSYGAETIILNITLNQEPKGEFFLILTDDRDFLVKTSDMKTMGFRELAVETGKITMIADEPHVSLKSLKGVEFVFNEKTLTLEITADPNLLPKRVIDFMPQRQPKVYYPRDNSAFLNYRFDYSAWLL